MKTKPTRPIRPTEPEETLPTLNGMDTLFHGYNVLTSEYPILLNAASPGNPLIQPKDPDNTQTVTYNGTDYELPAGVGFQAPVLGILADARSGSSESSYTSQLAASVGVSGSYGMFTGSFEASYGSSVSVDSSYYYTTCIETGEAYTLGFDEGDVDLDNSNPKLNFEVSEVLSNAFANIVPDNDGSAAQDFFNTYGTHIISGMIMGGQTNYSMYGSQEDFDSESDFSSSAEAQYCTVSGSAAFDYETSTSTKNVESQSSLNILGGDTNAASALRAAVDTDDAPDAYTAWFNSIPGNEAWYGLTETGGLSLISDFCTIPETKTYLENVYDQLTGVNIVTSSQNVNDQSVMEWSDSPGATSGDYLVNVKDQTTSGSTKTWSVNSNELLVGFGGKIDSDKHLAKMVVVTLNTENQEYNAYYFGGSDSTDWEAFCMAPKGSVITGLGMTMKDKSFANLVMFTQGLNLCAQDGNFLDDTVKVFAASQSDSQNIDFENLPFGTIYAAEAGGNGTDISYYNRSATPDFPPQDGNQNAITGLSIHSTKNGTPNNGFDFVTTNFSSLNLEVNPEIQSNVIVKRAKRKVKHAAVHRN